MSSPTFVPESPDWSLDETADAPQSSLLSSLFLSVLKILISLLQIQVARRSLTCSSQVACGCSLGGSPFFLGNNAHSEKFAPRPVKKGSRPGGSSNSLRNNQHSGKAHNVLSFSFNFFHFLSFSLVFFRFLSFSLVFFRFSFVFHSFFIRFSFTCLSLVFHLSFTCLSLVFHLSFTCLSLSFLVFHFLSCSFVFFHFLTFSFIFFHCFFIFHFFIHFLSFSFMFHVLSCSFMFFHVLPCSSNFFQFLSVSFSFFHFLFFFSQVLKILSFFASIASRFPIKALMKKKKNIFWAVSGGGGGRGGTPSGPLFFLLSIFEFVLYFFIFVFFFNFFPCFSFFSLVFPFSIFLFLYFPFKKCFFLFHFVSLSSFLGCSKSVAALQDSLGESAHSELALFALYWLVVTIPCGIVLYVVRWVCQVLPSYQNRQIGALDETADAPQSSLLSSLFLSVLKILISLLQIQVARRSLTCSSQVACGCSLGGSPFFPRE